MKLSASPLASVKAKNGSESEENFIFTKTNHCAKLLDQRQQNLV